MILHFPKSNSKYYREAVRLSSEFNSCADQGVTLNVSIKEIFERWESFNKLFWTVVDWKGSFLEYENTRYFSHADKTRLFYSMQLSHSRWMNFVEMKASRFFIDGKFNDGMEIEPNEADYVIDLFTIRKDDPDTF